MSQPFYITTAISYPNGRPHIGHAYEAIGTDAVALGSDFDGAVKVPFDASGMALLTEALLNENFTDEEIAKIMGGNIARVLGANLPD